MSVINVTQEAMEDSRLPQITKCAFVGPRWSGKTHRLGKERHRLILSGYRVHVLDLNDIVSNVIFEHSNAFKTENDMQAVARAVQQKHIDASVWNTKIKEYIDAVPPDSMILCEGVLYREELDALRGLGFYIVYVDAPMKIRLQRLDAILRKDAEKRPKPAEVTFQDVFRWVTHPTEKGVQSLMDYADIVIDSSEKVDFNKRSEF